MPKRTPQEKNNLRKTKIAYHAAVRQIAEAKSVSYAEARQIHRYRQLKVGVAGRPRRPRATSPDLQLVNGLAGSYRDVLSDLVAKRDKFATTLQTLDQTIAALTSFTQPKENVK